MLVSGTQNAHVGGPTRGPNARGFAFWWNIGFKVWKGNPFFSGTPSTQPSDYGAEASRMRNITK